MEYTFSFWNYGTFDKYYGDAETAVKEWKELGITLGFTFRYEPSPENRKKMVALLDACARENMQVILYDARVFCESYFTDGEDAYRAGVTAAEKDFGKHPAVWGWYVGDEPNKERIDGYLAAVKIVKELSKKRPFINFYPGGGLQKREYGNRAAYADALVPFAKELPVLAFDRYSQCYASEFEIGWQKFGLDEYFYDLNVFRATAEKAGVPCWMSALSVGHWNYRTPTIEDIRWQIATQCAHGMQGTQWFFLYQHRWADDYWGYAVQLNGHKTELYYDIAQETHSFTARILSALEGYAFDKVWHISTAFGDTEKLPETGDGTLSVKAYHRLPGILTRFVSADGKAKYLLVNNDQRTPEVFGITDKTGVEKTIWLPPGGSTVIQA